MQTYTSSWQADKTVTHSSNIFQFYTWLDETEAHLDLSNEAKADVVHF
jgi:hypothetical protein